MTARATLVFAVLALAPGEGSEPADCAGRPCDWSTLSSTDAPRVCTARRAIVPDSICCGTCSEVVLNLDDVFVLPKRGSTHPPHWLEELAQLCDANVAMTGRRVSGVLVRQEFGEQMDRIRNSKVLYLPPAMRHHVSHPELSM